MRRSDLSPGGCSRGKEKKRGNQKWGRESEIEVSRVAAGYLCPHRMVKCDAFPVLRIVFSIPSIN